LDEPQLRSQQAWIDAIKDVQVGEIQDWCRHYLAQDTMWSVAGSEAALSSAQGVL